VKQENGLEKLEREAFVAAYQDGILDFLVGLSLVGMSLCLIYDIPSFGAIMPVMAIILHPGLKKAVVTPRLGYVKYSAFREHRLQQNKWLMMIVGVWLFILGVGMSFAYSGYSAWQRWIRELGAIPIGLVLATAAAALGILYGVKRGSGYALLIVAAFLSGHLLDWHLSIQLMTIGLVLSLNGLVLFVRFVRRYPRLPEVKTSDH